MKYDLYKDQLLYNHILESGPHPLVLNKTRIDSFYLGRYTFHHLRDIPGDNSQADAGYYEIITAGRTSFYIKWEKEIYRNVILHGDGSLNVEIDDKITRLKGVEIIADKYQNVSGMHIGLNRIEVSTIKQVPAAMGETDILKNLAASCEEPLARQCAHGIQILPTGITIPMS